MMYQVFEITEEHTDNLSLIGYFGFRIDEYNILQLFKPNAEGMQPMTELEAREHAEQTTAKLQSPITIEPPPPSELELANKKIATLETQIAQTNQDFQDFMTFFFENNPTLA